MTQKVAIIADSTASLSADLLKEYNIYTNHLMIMFGNDAYEEFKDITPEEFIEKAAAQKELPTTSQPAIGVTAALYERLLSEGYTEILHVTISGSISGSYQSAVSAAEMVDQEKITVFDSKSITWAQGGLAVVAAKLVRAGKTVAEIIPVLEEMRKTSALIAGIKNLENLRKSGRLSNASAVIGGVLQIKPVVHLTETGHIEALGKVRTFKKAIDFIVQQTIDAKLDETYEIAVLNMGNAEEMEILRAGIQKAYPNHQLLEFPLSMVVGAHTGPGAVGVSWIKTKI